ncbi:MAG TPA: dihydropteroate synthase [Longimicrobiales bacterium]|nr:dihydropteroate synthase [Longimicrobiales bacterium]
MAPASERGAGSRLERTLVAGVINVTPDSFSDGGRYLRWQDAVARAHALVEEGADVLDVGGESTRPGSDPVGAEEELDRVARVVEEAAALGVPVSIDTYKPAVARECIRLGARIVNDVTGLADPEMVRVIREGGAGAIVMHMRGRPKTMQEDVSYEDLLGEIRDFLAERAERGRAAGIEPIWVDPGIGFGKTAAHNFQLLARLGELTTLGYPVLVGPSRKSFLGSLPSRLPPEERLEGTLAAVAVAVWNGASIVRVHDVRPARRVVEVVDAMRCA